MIQFIKKLFSKRKSAFFDLQVNDVPGGWHIPQMDIINTQLFYRDGSSMSLTYMGDKNRLELIIDSKPSPTNITSRSCTTINSRLKKAGKEEIPRELFEQWELELMEAQGKGKNTYHSARFPKKKA